jgi:signal transduction histidine kinase
MLYDFIETHSDEIRRRATEMLRTIGSADDGNVAGLTVPFLEELVGRLRAECRPEGISAGSRVTAAAGRTGTRRKGEGVEVIVQSYRVLCDAITNLAIEYGEPMGAHDYRVLSGLVDETIVGAIEGFVREKDASSREHFGVLSHELRNATHSAIFALRAIQRSLTTTPPEASIVLERSLRRIGDLVTRSVEEVREGRSVQPCTELLRVVDVLDEVGAAAAEDAAARQIAVEIAV